MSGITIYEYDVLTKAAHDVADSDGMHAVSSEVYDWLEEQCIRLNTQGQMAWLRLTHRRGRRVVQVSSYVGVIRSPGGFQIEVLPKVGKAIGGGAIGARRLLIEMLKCLRGFRHIQTDRAMVSAAKMPLLEVFLSEFLQAVEGVVKRGLRSDYANKQDNLFTLRGKLLVAPHLRRNLFRADRFFTEHHEFTVDRPENRLIHAALCRVLVVSGSQCNLQLGRELQFVFADVPASTHVEADFQRVRLDRGMGCYADALAWARLILDSQSPLTGVGSQRAPSLLFPMEAVFEAFVAKNLVRQLVPPLTLKTQARTHHLVRHLEQSWFQLRPDMLVRRADQSMLVLDAKWKLLGSEMANGSEKYGLSQGDFYQLYAYGQSYLNGDGDVILVYPRTAAFDQPLPVFEFPKSAGLRLWVVPFCLASKRLAVPLGAPFASSFKVQSLIENGGYGWTRTTDPSIMSAVL